MLNIYLISVIMILAVLGIYFLVKEITSLILKNRYDSCVVLRIYDNAENVENIVRDTLTANPESDIFIINKSKNSEISEILSKLEQDYARIHIKTC